MRSTLIILRREESSGEAVIFQRHSQGKWKTIPVLRMDKLGNPGIRRVAVLRALQLGDLLCTVPALRALRCAMPEAEITFIGLPWAKEFVGRFNHYLDNFIELPGYPGLPEREPQVHRLPGFLEMVQHQEFDLALQMHGSGEIVNPLVTQFGARMVAGFYLPWQYCPDEERFLYYPSHLPEIRRHLALIEHLGIPPKGEELEFPLTVKDWEGFRQLERRFGLSTGHYACIHPGARAPERRWPVERFAQVADTLAERGLKIVLTGTQEELGLTAAVATQMRAKAVDLAGQTSLGAFAALLSRARLLVSNDTGASHIADALCVPSVVLFSASEPHRWAPLDRQRHRVIEQASSAHAEMVLAEIEKLRIEEPAYAS